MSEIAVFAASDLEYRTLRASLRNWRDLSVDLRAGQGYCGNISIELFFTGMGPENAARVAERALIQSQARYLLICGFAGALAKSCRIGDLVIYHQSIAASGERLDCDEIFVNQIARHLQNGSRVVHTGSGLTLPRVVCLAAEKHALAEKEQAIAVDMESFQIITAAQRAGRSCLAVRVISDDADSDLPDLNSGIDPAGNADNFQMMLQFLAHPVRAARFLVNLRRANRILGGLLPALTRVISTQENAFPRM